MRKRDLDVGLDVAVRLEQGKPLERAQVREFSEKGVIVAIKEGETRGTYNLMLRQIEMTWEQREQELEERRKREEAHRKYMEKQNALSFVEGLLAVRRARDFDHPMERFLRSRKHMPHFFAPMDCHYDDIPSPQNVTIPLSDVIGLQQKEQRLDEMEKVLEDLKPKLVKLCVELGYGDVTSILKPELENDKKEG
jgi:hypothetical protein